MANGKQREARSLVYAQVLLTWTQVSPEELSNWIETGEFSATATADRVPYNPETFAAMQARWFGGLKDGIAG